MKHYGDKHAKLGHILQSASNNMLMFPEVHPEVGCIVVYCSLSGLEKGMAFFFPNPHKHALTLLLGNVYCLGVKSW